MNLKKDFQNYTLKKRSVVPPVTIPYLILDCLLSSSTLCISSFIREIVK